MKKEPKNVANSYAILTKKCYTIIDIDLLFNISKWYQVVVFVFSSHKVVANLQFLWRLAERWLSPLSGQNVCLSLEIYPVKNNDIKVDIILVMKCST